MNYHLVRTDDMLNGDGLRVVIFLSGCIHHCEGCHNPETWDANSGKPFTKDTLQEILDELNNDYISGITFSGGDPLSDCNLWSVAELTDNIRATFPKKSIWLYTGYVWEDIFTRIENGIYKNVWAAYESYVNAMNLLRTEIIAKCDVLVDGKFIKSLADVNCPWVGSTNQRVIDVQQTLKRGEIVLYEN